MDSRVFLAAFVADMRAGTSEILQANVPNDDEVLPLSSDVVLSVPSLGTDAAFFPTFRKLSH
jgi:hypothetical protein